MKLTPAMVQSIILEVLRRYPNKTPRLIRVYSSDSKDPIDTIFLNLEVVKLYKETIALFLQDEFLKSRFGYVGTLEIDKEAGRNKHKKVRLVSYLSTLLSLDVQHIDLLSNLVAIRFGSPLIEVDRLLLDDLIQDSEVQYLLNFIQQIDNSNLPLLHASLIQLLDVLSKKFPSTEQESDTTSDRLNFVLDVVFEDASCGKFEICLFKDNKKEVSSDV
jgi:hypothetical protein